MKTTPEKLAQWNALAKFEPTGDNFADRTNQQAAAKAELASIASEAIPALIAELTMAPRAVKTMGYRSYYAWWLGKVSRACLIDTPHCTPESVEKNPDFLRWIDTEWQYNEVEL